MQIIHAPFKLHRMAALLAGVTLALTAGAQSLSSSDQVFMKKAATGGMAEVQLGNLAQDKSSSEAVKDFGSRMVTDHSKANDKLKQIAADKNVELPTTLGKQEQAEMKKLQTMSGANFDKAYMKHMLSDHHKDIAGFEKEAKSGKDADVKAFASDTLPTLREHLQLAKKTEGMLKQ